MISPNTKEKLKLPLLVGLIVLYILFVYKPYEFKPFGNGFNPYRDFGFAVIAVIVIYLTENYGRNYIDRYTGLSRHGVGHNVIYAIGTLLFGGICCALYAECFAFPVYGDFVAIEIIKQAFLIGAMPMLFVFFYNYMAHLRKEKQSRVDNVNGDHSDVPQAKILYIKMGSDIDPLEIPISNLILCQAMGNHVTLHYLSDGELSKKTLRKTLLSIEQDIDAENFVRCHRSTLVNMDYVIDQKGNSKAMQLTVEHLDEEVQVSRNYVSAVRVYDQKGHPST